jgi:hypothetical protein
MAYVYRHIRLDKNEPFYIGIGNDSNYRRAKSKDNRNKDWHTVVDNCQFDIEILVDNIDYEFAKKKEKEFVRLYGRLDLGTGILVNRTDGGQGNVNWSEENRKKLGERQRGKKASEETRRRLSESHKGYKPTPQALENMRLAQKGKVISRETREKMASKLRGRKLPDWQRKILSEAAMGKRVEWCHRPITQLSVDGDVIKEFESMAAASRELKIQRANIHKVVSGERMVAGGFHFKYKNK